MRLFFIMGVHIFVYSITYILKHEISNYNISFYGFSHFFAEVHDRLISKNTQG